MSKLVRKAQFLLLMMSALVLLRYPQMASGQYGDYSLGVEIQIITGTRSLDFYVGDTFHYNITLRNIGTQAINSNFTVSVYNPSRELLGTRIFQRSLSSGQVVSLFPSKETPVVKGQTEYDVFYFDSVGSYKLQISSSQSLLFWRFGETEYNYIGSPFAFYFDAMSRWEKSWRDTLSQWQATNEDLTKQALTTSTLIFRLSYIVGFLTIFNLATAVGSATHRVRYAVVVLLVGSLLFVLAMAYLWIP